MKKEKEYVDFVMEKARATIHVRYFESEIKEVERQINILQKILWKARFENSDFTCDNKYRKKTEEYFYELEWKMSLYEKLLETKEEIRRIVIKMAWEKMDKSDIEDELLRSTWKELLENVIVLLDQLNYYAKEINKIKVCKVTVKGQVYWNTFWDDDEIKEEDIKKNSCCSCCSCCKKTNNEE